MNKFLRRSPILLVAPLLLGATPTPTSHSDILNYTVRGHIIKTGSKSVTVNSSRDQLMGTMKLEYEVIHYNDASYVYINHNNMRYYTVNYRITLTPEKEVKYANGLFGWFTETGDAAVKKIEATTSLGKEGISDLSYPTFLSSNKENIFNLYLPSNNTNAYGNMIDGAKYFYKSERAASWYGGLTSEASGYTVKTENYDSSFSEASNNSLKKEVRAEFINRPKHEVTFYGCADFLSTNEKDSVKISANAWFIIAENSFYGSDEEVTPNLSVDISWDRPELLY